MNIYDMGYKAASNGINNCYADANYMNEISGLKVGEGLEITKEWNKGNFDANEAMLKAEFPEMYS